VSMIQDGNYDVVLMDLRLPGIDGFAATRQIRRLSDKKSAEVPIVAMTADAVLGIENTCRAVGMQGFLTKPINKAVLSNVLAISVTSHGKWHDPLLVNPSTVSKLVGQDIILDEAYVAELKVDLGLERFSEAITACCKSLQECAVELQEGRKNQNLDQIARVAHRLKGVAGSYGLILLQNQAEYLREADGKNGVISLELDRKILRSINESTQKLSSLIPC